MSHPKTNGQFFRVPLALSARKDLTGNDKLLLALIAYRVGENGKCWPTTRRLADDCGIHHNHVSKALRRLEAKGLLVVERRGRRRGNHYRLTNFGNERLPKALGTGASFGNERLPALATKGCSKRTTREKEKKNTLTGSAGADRAPPSSEPVEAKPTNGADLVRLWLAKFKEATGEPYAANKAKLGAILKQVADGLGPEEAAERIKRWLGHPRDNYTPEFFKTWFQSAEARDDGDPFSGSRLPEWAAPDRNPTDEECALIEGVDVKTFRKRERSRRPAAHPAGSYDTVPGRAAS